MGFLTILLTGFALAMDAFAVSVTKGMTLRKITSFISFKIAFFFGLFQGLMPFIGWFVGIRFQIYIQAVDHWIALFLLSFIGLKMIFEAYEDSNNPEITVTCDDELDNRELIILSIATSIDALAVGISFAFLNVHIIPLCLSIGLITFVLCFLGVMIGKFLGPVFKNYSQIIGGIILILIGINILNEHTNFIYKMLN
ncbi:MAG: manganese efflux pump MntP family protein [Terrisporobacter othiniensis]|uniref:Putative manganese efflux pump MntP n=2 Tax=Terrisporobacter TaxID=1505652 RepID=A0AAX2ZI51_9FIRM|nr:MULTISPECIES: manganese efflux pump MntP family protein [Terrisporobacter]MBN9645369.1 manganese efflux pump [Terrisporobacter glycolicus]MDU4862902.1 manganese efflux pump MntP family protein [Terrisporobacter othiniensis]MDU6995386.1 manganese efflux pump MntP family protein [Terrisporobacter othiniensis]UEL48057.1 manganese efflux pump MntP family protein [Terrisporobacter hibernicus]SFJ28030.1 Putative Mn2+ efflux pump MntP [Terrisporobacter glycolicus]